MRFQRCLGAMIVLALAGGCAGGRQTFTPPLAVQPAAGKVGTLTFTLTIPKKVNPKAKSYVSPASKGLYMNFYWGSQHTEQTFALKKGATGCAPSGKNLVCTISVSLAPGQYYSSMIVYDQAPQGSGFGSGARVLSEICCEALQYTIKSGKTTTIHPILQGNIWTLAFSNFPQTCISGSLGATTFKVKGFDADKYTIAGPYFGSVQLNDSDTSGNTTLTVRGPDNPPPDTLLSSHDTPTISYNGKGLGSTGGATITASETTAVSASATLWSGPGDVIFNYTGAAQHQTVSPCANSSVTVWLWGAAGGGYSGYGGPPGYGGLVIGTIPVTSGEQLEVVVGGPGASANVSNQGGYNGGGNGGALTGCYPSASTTCLYGGGGGGGTDIRRGGTALSSRVMVAGGGGGEASAFGGTYGGGGGGSSGAAGNTGGNVCVGLSYIEPIYAGGGGTQTSGGAAGNPNGDNAGTFGAGAPGDAVCIAVVGVGTLAYFSSGGGGGGWYGGGGGYHAGPGGGGSGYAEPSATGVFMETGFNSGQGIAEICWPQPNDCKVTLKRRHDLILKQPRRH